MDVTKISFPCFCYKAFKTNTALLKHISQHKKSMRKAVRCKCGKVFASVYFLCLHFNMKHRSQFQPKLHPCHHCPKVFVSLQSLRVHRRKHHSTNCHHCCKMYKSVVSLNRHINLVHLCKQETYRCMSCSKQFCTKNYLMEHVESIHQLKVFSKYKQKLHCCSYCGKLFRGHKFLEQHVNTSHQCQECGSTFSEKSTLINHLRSHNKLKQIGRSAITFHLELFHEIPAFQGYLCSYRYAISDGEAMDLEFFSVLAIFDHLKSELKSILLNSIQKFKTIDVQFTALVRFKRICGDNMWEYKDLYMNSYGKLLMTSAFIVNLINELQIDLQDRIDKFEKFGSGWNVSVIKGIDCRVNKHKSLTGSCFIKMPKKIMQSHAVVNVQNRDTECFKWAVLSILHPTTNHSERVSSYKRYENNYNWENLIFPMKLEKIHIFEGSNSVCVNVFGFDNFDGIYPLRISEFNYHEGYKTVNLLQVKRNSVDYHFGGIKDLSKLLGKRNCHAKDYCYNCNCLIRKSQMEEHFNLCTKNKCAKIIMPQPNKQTGEKPKLKFKDYHKKLKAGFTIYCDLEAILKPIHRKNKNHRFYRRHVPSGVSYVVIRDDGECIYEYLYRGKDCIQRFFEEIEYWGSYVVDVSENEIPPIVTPESESCFELTMNCHICGLELNGDKCWDHCHRTGNYRGAAHTVCNLNYKMQPKIPIVMHNFRGYDCHFIMEGFRKYNQKDHEIYVIPTNSEKYLSIICKKFYFIDSMQFLNSGLSQLVDNLLHSCKSETEKKEKFKLMYKIMENNLPKSTNENIDDYIQLLLRKGVYCYDYIKGWKTFDEPWLPKRKHFYNTLKESHITNEDYLHATNVFRQFKCKNIGEFHDIYLRGDVAQLAVIFENFRSFCLENYKLDPVHYFSIPGLAWDSLLLMSKVELDLLEDVEQYMFIESGIRGGVSMISKRYAKSNNLHCPQFNPNEEKSFIMFLDCNNLYGKAMMESLPVSDFKWENNIQTFDLWSLSDNGTRGAIIECDLSYPDELHDKHNDYPLAPEHTNVKYENFSNFQKSMYKNIYGDDEGKSFNPNSKKLIPHLGPRKNYVLHYRNLQFYLNERMKLDKIHRILSFNQIPWMKEFIIMNTKKRIEAENDFDRDLFKLIINSSFGKGCENVRKHLTVKIVNECHKAVMYASKSNLKKWEIIEKDLVTFSLAKKVIRLCKPIYTGLVVLELAKLIMYEFHYSFAKRYGSAINLLFTDTDSLCYHIKTNDVYVDLASLATDFDFSDYDKNHFLHSNLNRKVPGKMKDEFKGKIITEVVALCSKMYSVIGVDFKRKTACKGTSKYVVEKDLHHEVYKKYLNNQKYKIVKQNTIQSKNHKVFSVEQTRKSLHAFDTKRNIANDGIHTYAWFHHRTM